MSFRFGKQKVSDELQLGTLLLDIKKIMYANPNAALTQMRTFIEKLCTSVLIYEKYTDVLLMKLETKINEVLKLGIFNNDVAKRLHEIRRTGNESAHYGYYSKEEVVVYIEYCDQLLEEFIMKYEQENFKYDKNILRKYLKTIKKIEASPIFTTITLLDNKSSDLPIEKLVLNTIDDYDAIKKRMLYQLKKLEKIRDDLNIELKNINTIEDSINNGHFNIIVLGEVNRGKSTLINAILGENILPTDILPTTMKITKVMYGADRKASVVFEDGNLKEIDLSEIHKFIANVQDENDVVESMHVFTPNLLLKKGCIIVDTPGVNDINELNNKITYDFIPQADAIIFLLDSDQVLTKSEQYFLKERVLQNEDRKIFFVLNKADNLNNATIEQLKSHISDVLSNLKLENKYYVLSGRKALIDKKNTTQSEFSTTFNRFEADLAQFLVNEKGKLLITNNAQRIRQAAIELSTQIKRLYELSTLNKDELIKVKKRIEVNIENIKHQEEKVLKSIDDDYAFTRRNLSNIIYEEMDNSFNNLIRRLNDIDCLDKSTTTNLKDFTNKQINGWIKNRITPLLLSDFNRINHRLIDLLDGVEIVEHSNKLPSFSIKNVDILISNDYETSYASTSTKDTSSQGLFMGIGGIIAAALSGNILIGALGAFITSLFIEEDYEKAPQIDKHQLIRDILYHKSSIINQIESEILKVIDDHYSENKSYIKKNIQFNINRDLDLIELAKKEAEIKKQDEAVLYNSLNKYLEDLIIICYQNEQLML